MLPPTPSRRRSGLLLALATLGALVAVLVPGSSQADAGARAGEGTARLSGPFQLTGTWTESYLEGVEGTQYAPDPYTFRSSCAGTKACAKVVMTVSGDRKITLERKAPGVYRGDVDFPDQPVYVCYEQDGAIERWSQSVNHNVKFAVTVTKAKNGKVKALKGTTRNTFGALDLTGAPAGCDEAYFGFPEGVTNVLAAKFTGVPAS